MVMAKAGRKRKSGKRFPNGQLAHGRADARGSMMAVALAQPHRASLPEALRRDQRAESALGRLGLVGLLDAEQVEAGEQLRRAVVAFRAGLAQPLGTRCGLAGMVAPGVAPEPEEVQNRQQDAKPETEEERADRVLGAHDRAMRALDAASGGSRSVARLVLSVCVEGQGCAEFELPELRRALGQMAVAFGLAKPQRPIRTFAPGPARRPWGHGQARVVVYERE